MELRIELDREQDGRWIAEIPSMPGVMAYGVSQLEACDRAKALALRVIADMIEHGEIVDASESFRFSLAA